MAKAGRTARIVSTGAATATCLAIVAGLAAEGAPPVPGAEVASPVTSTADLPDRPDAAPRRVVVVVRRHHRAATTSRAATASRAAATLPAPVARPQVAAVAPPPPPAQATSGGS